MEYVELIRATLDEREREAVRIRLAGEARRLGAAHAWSPLAQIDGLLIRASRGAAERQARRDQYASTNRELVS